MALSEDMALLNRVELFRELGEDKLRLIAFGAERRRLQAGQVLFRQDAPADCAFVIASGSFELSQQGRDGKSCMSLSTFTAFHRPTSCGKPASLNPACRSG